MQILIELQQECKKMVDQTTELSPKIEHDLISAVRNGITIAPHGTLKDIDSILNKMKSNCPGRCEYCTNWAPQGCELIMNEPTVIERSN